MRTESRAGYLRQDIRGNVRIRLHRFGTERGTRYGIELSAYNAWAGQFKLVSFETGLALPYAEALFRQYGLGIAGYDWEEGDFIPADR